MAIPYGYDRWLAPVTLAADARTVVGGSGSGSITAGIYYPYAAPAITSYASLYTSLSAALTTACGVAVSIEAASPSNSPGAPLTGLRFRASSAFSLLFSSGSWTLDPRLLGFPATQAADVASVADGADHIITSPLGAWPMWIVPKPARAKLADTAHEQYGRTIALYRWDTAHERVIEYGRLPAASVRASRAGEDTRWAQAAGKGLGDIHGCYETVWDEGLSKGLPVIVVHNEGRQDLLVATHPYEVVEVVEERVRDRFSGAVTRIDRERGELYDLEIPVEVITSTYEH